MPMRAVTVTTSVTEIADYNPQRVAFALQNNGTVRVFVSHDAVNILSSGVACGSWGDAVLLGGGWGPTLAAIFRPDGHGECGTYVSMRGLADR
jgi:hypothetical protein